MRPGLRALAVLLVTCATFYFTTFVLFAIISGIRGGWIAPLASLVCAIGAGIWVWKATAPSHGTGLSDSPNVLLSGVLVGSVGFACGYAGPIYFDAGDLGPLLGLFVTGPGGFIIGIVTAVLVSRTRLQSTGARGVLVATATVVGVTSLLLSIPESRYVADVMDATPISCRPASDVIPEAVGLWDRRLSEHTDWKSTRGWKDSVPGMAAAEPGIELTMQVHRHRRIDELLKPWNRGRLQPQPWRMGGDHWSTVFFLHREGGTCLGFELGTRQSFAIAVGSPEGTPPNVLHFFFGLAAVGTVPANYLVFMGD